MKDKNDFVRKENFWAPTLLENVQSYNGLQFIKQGPRSVIEYFDELVKIETPSKEPGKLSFKQVLAMYRSACKDAFENTGDIRKRNIELGTDLRAAYPDLDKYLTAKEELREHNDEEKRMLNEDITFDLFTGPVENTRCFQKHFLIRTEDELRCACCGATTKDYELTKEELDFLTKVAEAQDFLIDEATKDDIPLIQNLIDRNDLHRSLGPEIDKDEPISYDQAEEEYLAELAEVSDIRREVKFAHMLDAQEFDEKDYPFVRIRYFSDIQAKILLNAIDKDLKAFEQTDSEYKDLMIEDCKIAKYEVLMLSGSSVPELFKGATDEDDKIALTKAYYNISDPVYRENSNYFDSEESEITATDFKCLTADKGINGRIRQLKLKN